ncbi:MAG: phytoene/squalene synthase family protein, partial [Limisphaerales bacterium]
AKRYDNFEALEKYCYHVASVVGLLSVEIFGYKNPATRDYAIHVGKALQLTNILRDVKTDAGRGRIYLPFVELKKFNVSENDILNSEFSECFEKLAANIAARAKNFYALAQKTLPPEDRQSMVAAELMGAVYWQLLQKLERQKFNVFGSQSIRVSKIQKLFLIFRSWLRFICNSQTPNYGMQETRQRVSKF